MVSKLTAVLLSIIGTADAVTNKQACMQCKRADTNAGYMTSFSYCSDQQDEKCLQNFWEYIQPQMQCVGAVTDGWTLDIDSDCAAVTAAPGLCPTEFISSEVQYGTTLPAKSVILGENTKCSIKIDATQGVARVAFSGTRDLGVLYPSYVMETPITIEKGQIRYITVYNGKAVGTVSFAVLFSSAASLTLSGLAAVGLITINM